MDEFQHVVAGQRMNITLFDFKLRACRHLEDEQAKTNPDNALIALLCEGVRLARECETDLRRPIPTPASAWECKFCKNVFMQPGTYYCINCARCPHGVRSPHECREGCQSSGGSPAQHKSFCGALRGMPCICSAGSGGTADGL